MQKQLDITFTASGTDNIDPPWPWEGNPFSGSTVSQDRCRVLILCSEKEAVGSLTASFSELLVLGEKVF